MTRNELIGSLIDEGFDRKSAEWEADVILGSIEDDAPTSEPHANVVWDLIVKYVGQVAETC